MAIRSDPDPDPIGSSILPWAPPLSFLPHGSSPTAAAGEREREREERMGGGRRERDGVGAERGPAEEGEVAEGERWKGERDGGFSRLGGWREEEDDDEEEEGSGVGCEEAVVVDW